MELPLDGDAPILRILPQDSGFQAFTSRCKAAYSLAPPALISGRPAWSAPAADASPPFLGNLRRIPTSGARFVAITEPEAQDILAKIEKWVSVAQGKDYAPLFKTAEVLPPGTVCVALEMKNRFASGPGDPFSQILVAVPVGRGNVIMVKLADGRLGLIPDNDFFSGYTDYFRKVPDPLFAPPLGARGPGTQGSPPPGNDQVSTAQTPGGQPSSIIKLQPTEVTVGPGGLQLLPLPKPGYAVAFTVPANTVVIIDAKSPEGWIHVVAKRSKENWTATPPYYGWARPDSFRAP